MINSLIASSSIRLKDRVYIIGGYNGTTYSQMVTIKPNENFCQTASTRDDCVAIEGCDFCVTESTGKCLVKTSDR